MLPADEGLDLADLTGDQVDDRLVVDAELLVGDRPAQLDLDLETPPGLDLHRLPERGVAALAQGLRLVQGDVGRAQQLVGVVGRGLADGDADAGGDDDLVAIELERSTQALEQALGDALRGRQAGDVLDEDGELVAAQPSGGVTGAQDRPDPLGDADQQLIAGPVAEGVVDDLEVVEIDEQDGMLAGHRPLRVGLALERLAQPVLEQRPVGQVGQRVVQRLVGELLLEALPVADVAGDERDATELVGHVRIGEKVRDTSRGVPSAVTWTVS